MSQKITDAPVTQPDWLATTYGRLPDGGPPYTETPLDPYAPDAPYIAEPWNAVTASFFVFIAIAWLWRLRGRYREYPFVSCCMPILLTGGIGGTLFHATRVSVIYFQLDVLPIGLLGLLGAMYMALRVWGRVWGWLLVLAAGVFYIAINGVFFALFPRTIQWSINMNYAALAAMVLVPTLLMLWRTRFRHAGWIVAALISFAIAWVCRLIDRDIGDTLPMGSHWLWHTFGAITTALVIQFFYKVEGDRAESEVGEPKLSPVDAE